MRCLLLLWAMLLCTAQSATAIPPPGEPARAGAGAVVAGRYGDGDSAGLLIFVLFVGVWISAVVLTIKLFDHRGGPLLQIARFFVSIIAALPVIALFIALTVMALQSLGWIPRS